MAIAMEQATQSTAPVTYRIGSRGSDVAIYQERLNQLGYNVGATDGIYGNKTASQVMKFQQSNGLTADGILGPKTISAMINAKTAGETAQVEAAKQASISTASSMSGSYPTAVINPELSTPAPTQSYQQITPEQRDQIMPPTGQQLGAQAQAFDPYAFYKPNVPFPVPNMAAFRQADANQMQGYTPESPTSSETPIQTGFLDAGEKNTERAVQTGMAMSGSYPANAVVNPELANTQKTSDNPTSGGGFTVGNTIPITPIRTSGGVGGGSITTQAPNGTVGATVTPEQAQAQQDYAISVAETQNLSQMSNDLFERLNTMAPDWNPETDPDYTRDAQVLENKVAQMMVARGGLYSSVARAALQSSLIDLQSNYRKQAFERFVTERDFVFKQLAFVNERIDAEFSKAMSLKNYDLAVTKEQFNQKMAIAQFNADQQYKNAQLAISRANASAAREAAAYQKQMAQAAYNQQQQYNGLKQYEAQLITGQALLTQAQKEYVENGYLTSQSQSYLGLKQSPSSNEFFHATWNKQKQIESGWETYRSSALSFGDAETTLDAYRSVLPVAQAQPEITETRKIVDPVTYEERTITTKY